MKKEKWSSSLEHIDYTIIVVSTEPSHHLYNLKKVLQVMDYDIMNTIHMMFNSKIFEV